MFPSNVFDPKVVKDKRELYWTFVMFPESMDEFALSVSVFVESLFEEFIGK